MKSDNVTFRTNIKEAYTKVRPTLLPGEQQAFDKAVQLLEELGSVPITARTLALDSAIIAGLTAISLRPIALGQLVPAFASLAKHVTELNMEVKSSGSSYRH